MKFNRILTAGSIIVLLCVCMTGCTDEQTSSNPETLPEVTEKETYPVLNDPNSDFIDAPVTAPVIIDPDIDPDAEPQTELFYDAPAVMPGG